MTFRFLAVGVAILAANGGQFELCAISREIRERKGRGTAELMVGERVR